MAPTPKINPVRRNARIGPLLLPAAGRQGPPPDWPLPCRLSRNEAELWETLWATPQAVAWEKLGYTGVIARYTLLAAKANLYQADPKILAETRQMEDRIGLTPKSMRMLLWEIAEDEVAAKREDGRAQASRDVRRRLRAVEDEVG